MKLRIRNKTGIAYDTKIEIIDEKNIIPLKNVTDIIISQIQCDGIITATLKFEFTEIDLIVNPSKDTVAILKSPLINIIASHRKTSEGHAEKVTKEK